MKQDTLEMLLSFFLTFGDFNDEDLKTLEVVFFFLKKSFL